MKSSFRGIFAFALCFAQVLALSGCSSVPPLERERRGFFEVLSELEPVYLHRSSRGFGREPASIRLAHLKNLGGSWVWPLVNVQVTSNFGKRHGRMHEGIDLRAKPGTPVYAVHPGKVIYSGSGISGYGRMVVLRHSSGISTVYAHASKLLVKKGQWVDQGERVALSGQSGRATGPHLHFEIRNGTSPVNPLSVLPDRRVVASRPGGSGGSGGSKSSPMSESEVRGEVARK